MRTDKLKPARPFLKWAGGKTGLLDDIQRLLPADFKKGGYIYIEPFVGSGALLFRIIAEYPGLRKIVINDLNKDLIDTYKTIKEDVGELISVLKDMETEYSTLHGTPEEKHYYYEKRQQFNKRNNTRTIQTALFIFLNKTCFNGLYRVNSRNEFNVPLGRYENPRICDEGNLLSVNRALQNVEIMTGDYTATLKPAGDKTLFYLDPPYKPVSRTSGFNSYAAAPFGDDEQIRLANFCRMLDQLNYSWILSNSDVRELDPENGFFDDLYAKFRIIRVKARRSINMNPKKRGILNELLITNVPEQSLPSNP